MLELNIIGLFIFQEHDFNYIIQTKMIQLKSIHIPLTYQKLYNKERPNLDELKLSLAKLDKQILLKCALTLLHNADSWSNINEFITHFFSKENETFVYKVLHRHNEIISELHTDSNGVVPQVKVLTKHSCLELLRIIFSVNFTGENICDNATLQLAIFDCLLVINDVTTPTPECPENMDKDLRVAYSALLNMLSYNDYTNIDTTTNFILQCYKSKLLFDFMDSQDNLKRLKDMYLEEMRCRCWEEYIFVLAKLFVLDYQDELPTTRIVLDESHPSFQHDKILLDNFALASSEEIPYGDNVDFIFFRNKPLILLEKNTYWVIDENFLANRLYISLFFGIKKQNDFIHKRYKIDNFFQFFTSKFSEETLFYSTMEHIIGRKSYKCYSGTEMRRKGISGEPDYYIRNGNDIFLFEFKDPLFRKEDKVECNYENVKSSIEEKLVHKKNGKPSAIEQLCNNIELILNDKFQIDLGIRSNKVRIYPILVVGDTTFTNVGASFILNDYFKNEISNRKIENKNIRPLILVNIDSLILYQFEFENKNLKLRDVLDSYLKFLNMEHPYGKNDIIRNVMHQYFSLDLYLKDKVPRKSNTYHLEPLIKSFRDRELT